MYYSLVDIVVEPPSGEVLGAEIIYAGERTLPFGGGLFAVPLSALWEG